MFRVDLGTRSSRYCDGASRRSFLQLGMSGLAGIGLGALLRARGVTAGESPADTLAISTPGRDTSVILIWLDGGPSHMDLYDLKPHAPAEYRGIKGKPTSTKEKKTQTKKALKDNKQRTD